MNVALKDWKRTGATLQERADAAAGGLDGDDDATLASPRRGGPDLARIK
jgi:hypothetical protein